MDKWPLDVDDDFMLTEGLDLLAGYRAIKSQASRKAVIRIIADIVEAEEKAGTEAERRRPQARSQIAP